MTDVQIDSNIFGSNIYDVIFTKHFRFYFKKKNPLYERDVLSTDMKVI